MYRRIMTTGDTQAEHTSASEPVAPVASGPVPAESERRERTYPSKWWLFATVIVIAAALRFFNLDHPAEVYFDETYYANDAVVYLEGPEAFRHNLDELYGGNSRESDIVPVGAVPGEISWVHPPLGKWIIASGIAAFGKNPWGWRSMSALFGVASVAATYLLALVLWRRHSWAFLAGLLIALDGLAIVESRVAMLDGFVSTFIVIAFLFVACERRRMQEAAAVAWAEHDAHPAWLEVEPGLEDLETQHSRIEYREPVPDEEVSEYGYEPARMQWRWLWVSKWRVLTGLALGAAIATKWTGIWAVFIVGGLLGAWSMTTRLPSTRTFRRALSAAPSLIVCLLLIPACIYLASYTGWFISNPHGSILSDPSGITEDFVKMQSDTMKYHRSLDASHPYQSTAGSWPLMSRPIAYWYEEGPEGGRGHILAVGNPGVWWPFLVVVPLVLAYGLVRRDWRDALILSGYFGLYLPWFANPRTSFFYYMTPIVPFIALTLVSAARRAPETLRPAAAIVVGGLAVVGCAFFYPIWTGIEIPPDAWNNLMVFQSWI